MLPILVKKISREDSGATMVESIPSVLITVILTLVLFDLARVLVIQGLLSYGAYSGLEKATKIPDLQLDGRPCSEFPNIPACDPDTQSHNQDLVDGVIGYVVLDAIAVPSKTLLGAENGTSSMRLLTSQSKVIRPGNPTSPGGSICSSPPSYDGYGSLMRDCPILVELTAVVKPLFPFIPQITLHGRAYGFREPALSGSYPVVSSLQPPCGSNCPPPPPPCGTPPPNSLCADPHAADLAGCAWLDTTCRCHCPLSGGA